MALLGAGACIIFTIGLTIVSRAKDPDSGFGISLVIQMIMTGLMVFIMTKFVIQNFGFSGFCVGLLIFYGLSAAAIAWFPKNFLKAEASMQQTVSGESRGINFAACLAAIALFIEFGAFSAMWGFMERIGTHNGVDPSTVGTVLSVSIVAGLVGALIAAVMGNRYGQVIPLSVGFVLTIVAVLFAKYASGIVAFTIVACTINGLLQYIVAYQMGLVAEVDYNGKYTVMIAFVLAFGGAVGPGVAGSIIETSGFSPVYTGICAITALSWMLTLVVG